MQVKENLVSFKVLWSGKPNRITNTQKTNDTVSEWLTNEALEMKLVSCGSPEDGPITFNFESNYSESIGEKALLKMNLRKLIKSFCENKEVERLWLQWNDVTDDIIWEDYGTTAEFNDVVHKKGDYILIHQI